MHRRIVHYGDKAFGRVAAVVDGLGATRVLLVCGKTSFDASGAAAALPDLAHVATVERWSDFAPNTDSADLVRGLAVLDAFRPDLVLGVGGGSAMDMAKLLCAYAGLTTAAQVEQAIRTGGPVVSRDIKLVLAPTTSGSGSEATHFAVVYIGAEKFSIAGQCLLPDAIIVDPTLTLSSTPYQRATSGIDAVAQAIESLWAAGATPLSRRYARHALGLLLPAIEEYVASATGPSSRAMAIGAYLAGRAINISKTTAAHALAYGITKGYGVSHGHAVAFTLGAFIEAHAEAPPSSLQAGIDPADHQQAMAEVLSRLGAATGEAARRAFQALMVRIGLDPSLSGVGATTPEARAALAASVNAERLGNNPVVFTNEDLVRLVSALP